MTISVANIHDILIWKLSSYLRRIILHQVKLAGKHTYHFDIDALQSVRDLSGLQVIVGIVWKNMESCRTKSIVFVLALASLYADTYDMDDAQDLANDNRKHETKLCKGIAFNQIISRRNCRDKYIMNKMCYGECISYYLPGKREDKVTWFACRPKIQET